MARVESKTYICTEDKRESVPQVKEGVKGQLGNWMSIAAMKKELDKRFPACMKGMCHDCDSPVIRMRSHIVKSSHLSLHITILLCVTWFHLYKMFSNDFFVCEFRKIQTS